MQHTIQNEHYLENEKIQFFIRTGFFLLITFHLSYLNFTGTNHFGLPYEYIIILLMVMSFINLSYRYYIFKCPFCYQELRILFIGILDVFAMAYAMYIAGDASVYYPALFLWFEIGYSMRYGIKLGFIIYSLVILAWLLLMYFSEFWNLYHTMAISWLFAYIIIPLYFFRMLSQLHHKVDTSIYKAEHDTLTNLPNRFLFEHSLKEYIQNYTTHQEKFALFFIDLDGFKNINDIYGHDMGDIVLIEASKRMCAVNSNTYRLGGDEFVSIVPFKTEQEVYKLAEQLIEALTKECQNKQIILSGSIGIACYPQDAPSSYELKKYADIAMYKAKTEGKNQYYCYKDITKY